MRLRAILGLSLLLGCTPPPPRFANRAILWHDPDDCPIPLPAKRPDPGTGRYWPGTRDSIFLPAQHAFTADYGREAVNINALDEVPDSSWFSDPKRDPHHPAAPPRTLSAEEIERGAATDLPPRPPFRVLSQKSGGSAGGFVVDDALGRRYLFKLDPAGLAGLISGADVVATRLAWAVGWRVPADQVIEFSPGELILSPTATMNDRWGAPHRFEAGDLEALLHGAARASDGRVRAVASRYISGTILGSFPWFGRRPDDPNDRYPHEDRRDLRGFGVWASWVDDIDTMENNTLDSYHGAPGQGHIVHYQQDVGGSFGTFAARPAEFWMGHESFFQPGQILTSLLTLGARPIGWESPRWQRRRAELEQQFPELAGYASEHFAPRRWRPVLDNPAFVRQTRRDRYWGAKQIVALSYDNLRAAVKAGHYRPAAARYLVDALWQRRQRIARDYFSESASLDYFRLDGERLCFSDLWITAGLGGAAATRYRAREDHRTVAYASGHADGRSCLVLPPKSGYRVIELAALRSGQRHFGPEVAVHLVAPRQGQVARIVGVIH